MTVFDWFAAGALALLVAGPIVALFGRKFLRRPDDTTAEVAANADLLARLVRLEAKIDALMDDRASLTPSRSIPAMASRSGIDVSMSEAMRTLQQRLVTKSLRASSFEYLVAIGVDNPQTKEARESNERDETRERFDEIVKNG